MASSCQHAAIMASEVSLLGEGVMPPSHWFPRKNRYTKMGNFTAYGENILCLTAANTYCGHSKHGCHRSKHEARGNEKFSAIYGRFTTTTAEYTNMGNYVFDLAT